ncbi:transport and Golgi organization protein 1 isoform X2 [Trichoplusia ni]|uniref:Transport and Golgi organization protein 1 isoform X2 n=1 Tax=Trichoplusia ni TaxID=7111 RepID=A0A7E5VY18_TRINI|nr:transport and Golgi organization protein 1 isoform X2 [Trichoplusia ni]
MIVFKLILFTLFISVAQCRIPDKVYCANKECDGPISKAKTLLSYTSVDPDLMSFRANSEAIIYMKSAGSNADLWYATINGKSGLVNTMFLREYKVIEKKPQFIVPYERNSQEDSVVPDKVQKPHEVFEGTTIYTTEAAVSEEQQDTSTESSPTVSNDKLTPELETVAESENQNDINNAPNEPSQETYEVEETVDEYPEEQENTEPVEAESQEINIDGETSAETIFDTNNEAAINNSQGETPVEDQPSNQVLHNELPPEALPPPQMLTMGSESVLKAPEQQEFVPNTLSETEQGDSQEQNISSPNSYSDSDKVQVAEETASEVDSENGNTIDAKVENPINEHSESPINEPEDSPTSESTVIPTTEPTVSTTLEPEINQNYEPQQVIPPIYNYNTGNQEISSTTTEAPPQEENTEGFFSNMYSTVADIFPSSTETPEPLYNTEFPTHESEKADGNEGFSFLKYFMSTYYSVFGTSEETKALFASVGETCYSDEYCDGTSNDGSNRLLTFLLTTASSVLLFTLGYYYIDNRRQDGRLIGTINSLQRDLLFTTKECEILKEELLTTKNKLAGIEDSSFGMDDMVQSLKEEINELKATNDRLRNSLDDNEKLLRVSENTAGELQNTLGEVENTLSELLAERANSEEQIVELNGKIQAFEEELITVSRERDNFQLKYVSAESALEEFKKQKKQLEDVNQQLAEAKNTIELQKHEIEALKDAIKELKNGMSSDVDVTSFIDHTEIKAKLSKALQEKNTFESKFETEYKERTRLAEELKTTQETLTTTSQSATEALTRLEVLGKYFQERENELLKELSTKESLWLSKQGESASTVEKMELLQQEIQRYKEKCDALTLELAEQESSRRSALSEVEARAHAAWLEARAARRDADAARGDAAALRRKLAALSALSAADGAVSPHHKVVSPLETAESPSLPPPLPPMFLPPPLLPPLPRPPPLGRLPSPHPPRYGDRRYSPDSRYSPGSRYSPDSRYSPETVRYSPDSRYSPRSRRSPYSPRSRRRSRSRESRPLRSRNGPAPADTETEYNSDSPSREPRRRGRYSRHSGPSSGSGCSSESDK